jgi:uncharacterized repeat protein (TIGR01451 family)
MGTWTLRRAVVLLASIVLVAASVAPVAGVSPASEFTATALQPSGRVEGDFAKAPVKNGKIGIIVRLGDKPVASYRGGVKGLAATHPNARGKRSLELKSRAVTAYRTYLKGKRDEFAQDLKRAVPGAVITHSWDIVVNGVSAVVPKGEMADVAALPGVAAVYPDLLLQLDTDRSPAFLGAPVIWNALGGQDDAGEGVIVGVLDSGVWPEHPSYSDPDPTGEPFSAPPPPLSGTRACEFSGGSNPGPAFACNNKLIAADRFMATYDAQIGLLPTEFTTARDDNGHGSHTSSTAAGNRGVAASIFGVARGTVSGIAPRAHVEMFKVCGNQGCFSSDSVAAIQKAIQDGVNVLNFSISGGTDPYADAVELAFLDAYNAGVFVAASAGNNGPTPETVAHRGPWVTTVGASTTDRAFVNTVNVTGSDGATLSLAGVSITAAISAPTPLVSAADAPTSDSFCANATADGAFAGKIVICERGGGIGRIQKGFNVRQRGAVGMVLYNNAANVTDQETDNHYLPASHIQFADGQTLLAFLASHTGVTATLTAGIVGSQQGDVMASFSSRGGPGQTLGVSKPDVTAPGVQILAGNTPAPATAATGGQPAGELFQGIAGTSMSSPHVAGSAALLKDLRPTWTPGQIKSALMTTANPEAVKEDGVTLATPFDDGSGRIALNKVGDPGATFDVPGADYLIFSSQLYRANYPSLYVPSMPGLVTVQRTLRSVLSQAVSWKLAVKGASSDLKITVPTTLNVPAGGNATFNITVDARNVPLGATRHASVEFTSANRKLRFPITIVRAQAPVTLDKTCAPAAFPRDTNTTCTLTIANPTFSDANVSLTDTLPSRLELVPGSATGGAIEVGNGVQFNGLIDGATPATIDVAPGSSPFGYVALGVAPITCAGNCDDTGFNFNVTSSGGVRYDGVTHNTVGLATNGFVQLGGLTSTTSNNQNLPNSASPNNVLAPLWTDLHPLGTDGNGGGRLRAAIVTSGTNRWLVFEWRDIFEFRGTTPKYSFETWLRLGGATQDISYTYGLLGGTGTAGRATVGAENAGGTIGDSHYFNGAGTFPTVGGDLVVTSIPGAAGETVVITFQAKGVSRGDWVNYAEMTADTFFGTSIARFAGTVQ